MVNLDTNRNTLKNKTAVIVVSDLHINSTVALAPPTINLDDGGSYESSRTQRWLWKCWTDFWARVNSDAGGYRKILVINGDLGELDTKRRSAQLITANKSTILNTVRDVLEPATWDALYVVRGTSAHEGRSAWLEEEIGKDFEAIPSLPDVHSWWQIRANVNGKNFDIAHHANMSGVPWGRINSAGKLINLALWNYMIDRRVAPPDVIDRSHNHIYVPAIGNGIEAYFLPCWTATTEFVYRIGQENTMPSIGGLVHYVEEDGAIRTKLYEYKAEKEKHLWSMKL